MAAVAAELLPRVLHRRDVAEDLDAGRLARDDEHRRPLRGARVGVGDGHHDQEVGDRPVGGEPLVPVDHPLLAVANRPGAKLRGIRPGRVRLGHAEGAAQVAREQRVQPAVLLLRRAGQREDLRVARVGRRVAERQRRDRGGAEDLVHQPEPHLPHPLAAELRRQVRGPQAARLDLLLQRRHRLPQPVEPELVPDRLQRPDLAADELAHPVELLLEVGIGGEVPAHEIASFRLATCGPLPGSVRPRRAHRTARRAPAPEQSACAATQTALTACG